MKCIEITPPADIQTCIQLPSSKKYLQQGTYHQCTGGQYMPSGEPVGLR